MTANVPPKLGKTPNLISGKPNLVSLVAIIISPAKANSNPPPKANLFTHEIIGFWKCNKCYLNKSKSDSINLLRVSGFVKFLIFAPAQNALSTALWIIITFIF